MESTAEVAHCVVVAIDDHDPVQSGPRLDGHYLLGLYKYGVPPTHRMPLFREQIVALIGELTDFGTAKATEYYYLVLRRDYEPLERIVSAVHREHLTKSDFVTLERILRTYAVFAMPYFFCSVMAHRAQTIAAAETTGDSLDMMSFRHIGGRWQGLQKEGSGPEGQHRTDCRGTTELTRRRDGTVAPPNEHRRFAT